MRALFHGKFASVASELVSPVDDQGDLKCTAYILSHVN
jgi:hypothetical protein